MLSYKKKEHILTHNSPTIQGNLLSKNTAPKYRTNLGLYALDCYNTFLLGHGCTNNI